MFAHFAIYGSLLVGTFAVALIAVVKRKIMMTPIGADSAPVSTLQFLIVSYWGVAIAFGLGYLSVWGASTPETLPGFYRAIFFGAEVNVLIQWLNAKAASYKKGEVSYTAPLQSMTPGLIFLLAILIGELPGKIATAGIVLMMIGPYIILYEARRDAEGNPVRVRFWHYFDLFKRLAMIVRYKTLKPDDREKLLVTWMALGTAFLGTFGLLFNGLYVRRGVDFQGLIFASMLFAAILAGTCTLWYLAKPDSNEKWQKWLPAILAVPSLSRGSVLQLLFLGWITVWVLHVILIDPAMNSTFIASVGSLKRFSIIFSVLIGWQLFKEGQVVQRMIAALFIIIGALMIAFDGLPEHISSRMELLGF